MHRTFFHPFLCAGVVMFVFVSCQKDPITPIETPVSQYTYEVPLQWNQLFLDAERFTPGYRPPVSARTSGYIGLAAYESIVHATQEYRSFSGYYDGLQLPPPDLSRSYDWEAVLNAAYEASFYYYFPTAPAAQQFRIQDLADRLHRRFEQRNRQEVYNRSVEYGHTIARLVYEWSRTDPYGDNGFLKNADHTYTPPGGYGKWQPTYPDFLPALLPRWGNARTFAARPTDGVPPPLPHSDSPASEIYQEALVTYELVNDIKAGLKPDELWIAEFWSDDCPILTFTPSARWVAIANQVIEKERVSLDYAVLTYAKVGMALCDAGIRCWGEKYVYNVERPIDYIRRVMGGAHYWNTVMCPDGSGAFYTPNFPGYPSGHATFGAAAATVLSDMYGHNYRLTDRCHEGRTEFRSEPRTFNSFHEMAIENGYSRIPLGVHFEMDSDAGILLGNIIGERVNNLPWK